MATAKHPDPATTRREFREAVNMTPAALRKWLATDASQHVGMVSSGGLKAEGAKGQSVGHHMGERVLELKSMKTSELTDEDYADMRKVIGYVHRHVKQRPEGDVTDTKWRKSLMNWGHDPLR